MFRTILSQLSISLSLLFILSGSTLYLLLKIFKTLWPVFIWMGFNCLKFAATLRKQFTFYHSVSRNSCHSFYRPRKDEERLSQPCSHPVVLSMEPLDWESSALTTRPLLQLCGQILPLMFSYLICKRNEHETFLITILLNLMYI